MWIALVVTCAACYALEFVRPVVPRHRIASWVWRVWSLNAVQVPVVVVAAMTWHRLAGDSSLLNISGRLDALPAGVVAYVAYTFVFYWWHRLRHASDLVWKTLHQIHHSASRLEMVTAFYKHPLETAANAILAGLLMFDVLGLDVQAALVAAVLAALADVFYHSNMRTPRWIGHLVQRPEMHRLHHEHGRHEGNYADLPLWDWLFGTLRLPDERPVACGFDPSLEEELVDMLMFHDVHATDRVR